MEFEQVRRAVCLKALDLLRAKRKRLSDVLAMMSQFYDANPEVNANEVFASLRLSGPNDSLYLGFINLFAYLDYSNEGEWAEGTGRSTSDRRKAIYNGLALSAEQREFCDEVFPRYPAVDPPIVITGDSQWGRWYVGERRQPSFYWEAYSRYLEEIEGWTGKNLAALDVTTSEIVERLADPLAPYPYQGKGLVVGYVQSGKTANYTGVVAKAVDTGYRLVIVLAGTINILREQTQRRLDKQLLGWELVRDDYEGDLEEHQFLHHGALPSELGAFDWERLTLAKKDFGKLIVSISTLEFRKLDVRQPLNVATNLRHEKVRLIVVKKNSTILGKLLDALKKASRRNDFSQVPALIIDDESDQASVNTRKPKPNEVRERTAINKHLVDLMKTLPRAQYVGYTATPFANVFIDPDDVGDLYPSDYLVSLPKPVGYMGVTDFYDATDPTPGDFSYNQNAYIRKIEGPDERPENLRQAIDAYIISGALKLFRENRGVRKFRHHTMLVHHSAFTEIHRDRAMQIKDLFDSANYLWGGPGSRRLEELWETDFFRVCQARAGNLPVPSSFEELRPYVGECCRRINDGDGPVLVVNGNDKEDAPNFEQTEVWKIIVGGTKLSRGYTVEGLTVSYYRRTAKTADTLMQMGRWFGFRAGYQDLVRLYIGTNEPLDKHGRKTIDLYRAFAAICLDEEEFRQDLRRYASLEGEERITPKQIPPLVPSQMLRPTAGNKMYNALLDFENYGGRWIERTVAPSSSDDLRTNEALTRKLLEEAKLDEEQLEFTDEGRLIQFSALTCYLSATVMKAYLNSYRWSPAHAAGFQRVLEFLEGRHGDPRIDQWLFLAPQMSTPGLKWSAAGHQFSERLRARVETGGRYGVFSEPDHRIAAAYAAKLRDLDSPSPALSHLVHDRQAVLVFYPVRSDQERVNNEVVNMGFGIQFPSNNIPRRVRYSVRRSDQADAVIVEGGR